MDMVRLAQCDRGHTVRGYFLVGSLLSPPPLSSPSTNESGTVAEWRNKWSRGPCHSKRCKALVNPTVHNWLSGPSKGPGLLCCKNTVEPVPPQPLVNLTGTSNAGGPQAALLQSIDTLKKPPSLPSPQSFHSSSPPGTPLIPHFPARDTPPGVIPVSLPPAHPFLTPNTPPIWFSDIPFAHANNPLPVSILHAPAESFASDTDSDASADVVLDYAERGGEGLWAGSSLGIVTGFQTRDSARITWVGGLELFSDEYANKPLPSGDESGNAQFARDVAAWTFHEKLVLRIDSTTHHLVNETEPLAREHYTINENIVFEAHISQYDPESGWAPCSDLQVDFTMFDSHIRTAHLPNLVPSPDRHGVFKFVLDYRRRGWTSLQSSTTVPVVPPRHDGYPRFLSAAWPYYTGAISTSVGFLLFATLWLAGDDKGVKKGKSAKTE
ncbi:Oligosaccharyltransferase 48 kDa subunit beta-domain-containing protein [Lactarius pseudohatsudake]|nr:Oligosaccharyltransferase 48 kDa subunit beta-domain-containing protein [Lactarius pseudohatsudake]